MKDQNFKNIVKDDVVDMYKESNEKLEESNKALEEKTNQVDTLRSEMDSLKDMFKALLNGSGQKQEVVNNKQDDIYMGSTSNKTIVVYADGKEITFAPDGDYMPLTKEEVNSIIKSKNKNLITNGLLRFEDKKYYDDFRVFPIINLSSEGIKELFEKDADAIVNEIKEAQNKSPRTFMLTHSITFAIGRMLLEGKIPYDYNKITPIEKFLKVEFRTIMQQIQMAKEVGYYK